MLRFHLLLALSLSAAGVLPANPATKATPLFSDPAAPGWSFVTNPPDAPPVAIATVCRVSADGVIAASGLPIGYLVTDAAHSDYHLHVEWRWTEQAGNSGILLHVSPGPLDRGWPTCFQIQLKSDRLGDFLPMAIARFAEPLTSAPGARVPQRKRLVEDAEKPVGEWNTADVVCRGGTIEYTLNGVLQQRVTGAVPSSGRIGIQFEGQPFELRAVSLTPSPAL